MSVVYVKKTGNVKDISGILSEIDPNVDGKTVFIKPNVVVPAEAESGIVADPKLVLEIIEFLRSRGAIKFIVAESPGIGLNVWECFSTAGYDMFKGVEDVELADVRELEPVYVKWKFGEIKVPKILTDSYYVDVAKLKTHMNTTVTLGLKNQKGIILDEEKKHFHRLGLDEPISELASAVKPDLTIIDGITGIEGDGPLYSGKKIQANLLVAGQDVVSVDATASRLMKVDPSKVEHIRLASQLGVGELNPEVRGGNVEELAIPFERANEEYFKLANLYSFRTKYACSMCGVSLYEAIEMVKKNPSYWVRYGPKLAYLVLLRGVNFISGGKNIKTPDNNGKLICFGNCTKKYAEENNAAWVAGCPPNPKDILDAL